MLKKRIIPCLDVRDGLVVKGTKFRDHKIVGDVYELAQKYSEEGADELVFYDITASAESRSVKVDWVEKISQLISIPFCVAGGIKSVQDAEILLNSGCEKISVNSMAIARPELIRELVQAFGRQAVVVGIDTNFVNHDDYIHQFTGKEETTKSTAIKTRDWIKQVQELGAGEIVLNCMSSDGIQDGYDLEFIERLKDIIQIPVVMSGGAGKKEDFKKALLHEKVSGALAASVFHYNKIQVKELKKYLRNENVPVRLYDR